MKSYSLSFVYSKKKGGGINSKEYTSLEFTHEESDYENRLRDKFFTSNKVSRVRSPRHPRARSVPYVTVTVEKVADLPEKKKRTGEEKKDSHQVRKGRFDKRRKYER